jgi:hypothetical protein
MSLVLKPGAISIAFGTVSFFMADDDKTIRVDVDQNLLADTAGGAPRTRSACKARLTLYKRRLARIAGRKYRTGSYKPEVRVLVVSITADDLV